MDDIAFTMLQQIMPGLSGAASEEEKASVILKLFLVCWNSIVLTVHRPLKFVAFNSTGFGRHAYKLRKQMQELKIDVARFSETHLKPRARFCIPNYHIYLTDC
jgi:hypothetical protein